MHFASVKPSGIAEVGAGKGDGDLGEFQLHFVFCNSFLLDSVMTSKKSCRQITPIPSEIAASKITN